VKEQFSKAMNQMEGIPIANWPKQVVELENATEQTFDSV
jgi:hypothetical protein